MSTERAGTPLSEDEFGRALQDAWAAWLRSEGTPGHAAAGPFAAAWLKERGFLTYATAAAEAPVGEADAGRCGDQSPTLLGAESPPQWCALTAGHAGWHKSDEGSEWNEAGVTAPPSRSLIVDLVDLCLPEVQRAKGSASDYDTGCAHVAQAVLNTLDRHVSTASAPVGEADAVTRSGANDPVEGYVGTCDFGDCHEETQAVVYTASFDWLSVCKAHGTYLLSLATVDVGEAAAPRVAVDDSRTQADLRMRERFVAEGGCADMWLNDASRCQAPIRTCCARFDRARAADGGTK